MKVIAIRMGYYNNKRVREGQVFNLKDKKHFSVNWMKEYKGKKKVEEFQPEEEVLSGEDVI
jgi:hypothetical protein